MKMNPKPWLQALVKTEPGQAAQPSTELQFQQEITRQLELKVQLAKLQTAQQTQQPHVQQQQQPLQAPQGLPPRTPALQQAGAAGWPPQSTTRAAVPSRSGVGILPRRASFDELQAGSASEMDPADMGPPLRRARSGGVEQTSMAADVRDTKQRYRLHSQQRRAEPDIAHLWTIPEHEPSDGFFLTPVPGDPNSWFHNCGCPIPKSGLMIISLGEYARLGTKVKGGLGVVSFCSPRCIDVIRERPPPGSNPQQALDMRGGMGRVVPKGMGRGDWNLDRLKLTWVTRGQLQQRALSLQAVAQIEDWMKQGYAMPEELEEVADGGQ
ncbi:hypothetical protein PLESTB_001690100 [Pleodorina starrii]|uniref:Uncharacterized protein n=1 Tax=Pleodorina starrii TaxID=330485 RepID=A0A9W6BZ20_9CHLO|nr:hypothetical protein PLESTM_001663100 [Pleodorina starrii]GLC60909.1 hypothetical protein PLESTB_001690100 [Pleodorina starrii]GLC66640.1 hypothetical protein PLESTF_000455800 [Pleodorina starrii]